MEGERETSLGWWERSRAGPKPWPSGGCASALLGEPASAGASTLTHSLASGPPYHGRTVQRGQHPVTLTRFLRDAPASRDPRTKPFLSTRRIRMLLELFQIQGPNNTGGRPWGNAPGNSSVPHSTRNLEAPPPPPRPAAPRRLTPPAPQKHPGLISWAPYCSFIGQKYTHFFLQFPRSKILE